MDVPSDLSRAGTIDPIAAANRVGSFFAAVDLAASIVSGLSESVKRPLSPIEIQWVELLGRWNWQWFATFTFKDETHPEAAAKAFRHWVKLLDESNGYRHRSKSTYSRRCIWARGLEWQKRGVIHFHALIGNIPYEYNSQKLRGIWQECWFSMGNTGLARIYSVEAQPGAAAYVSKYCGKGGEIDLSPNLAQPDLVGAAALS